MQAGDSIGVGYNGYAAIDNLGFDSSVIVHNASYNGETMTHGFDRRIDNEFSVFDATRTCILLLALGTNDLGSLGISADQLYRTVATPDISSSQRAGFYVAIITILPRVLYWSPAQETERLAYNSMVRGNAAGADAIVDWAADSIIGDGVDPGNSPYYADGLHPTMPGQQRLASIDATALRPLLNRPLRQPTA